MRVARFTDFGTPITRGIGPNAIAYQKSNGSNAVAMNALETWNFRHGRTAVNVERTGEFFQLDISNVIPAYFDRAFFNHLYDSIRAHGKEYVLNYMIRQGHHEAFARAAIKKVLRERGW